MPNQSPYWKVVLRQADLRGASCKLIYGIKAILCAEKDFVGRFLCTNITTESEIESKCKFKNEHFFRRFHINNMRPSAPCSRQMTVQILRIIHSFFFNTHEYEDEKKKTKLLFAFNAAINQCCCRHDDFKLLIHLFYLFKVNESQNLLDVHKFTG